MNDDLPNRVRHEVITAHLTVLRRSKRRSSLDSTADPFAFGSSTESGRKEGSSSHASNDNTPGLITKEKLTTSMFHAAHVSES